MSNILKLAAIAAFTVILALPAAAAARPLAHGGAANTTLHRLKATVPANAFGAAIGAAPSREIFSPDGRALGTDPDPNVRFELLRDWIRGR
jgi:hypothetical protein